MFNFSLLPDVDVNVFWNIMCEDENGKDTETLYEGSISGGKWTTVSEKITLPDMAKGASSIDLYMEGFPETASWRIDDVTMFSGNVETTTPTLTSPGQSSTTTSSRPPYTGNVLENGDFETGMNPWICNGCRGSVGAPSQSGLNSFLADERQARWAGPHQVLNTNVIDSLSKLNLAFNYSIYSEDDLSEYIWKITVTKDKETKYFDLHHGSVSAANWKTTFTYITFPEFVREAQHIELYLEAFPETASIIIDDVFLYDEDASDWVTDANERIEQIRKKNFNIAFVVGNESSEEITLEVTKKTHDFAFGLAVRSIQISQCLGADTPYCSFAKENFNYMTDTYRMKWPEQEPNQGELNLDSMEVVDKFIQWADENDMKVRGHSLLWARANHNPEWVGTLEGETLLKAMGNRVNTAVTMYDCFVTHRDVINEMIGNEFYVEKSGNPKSRE